MESIKITLALFMIACGLFFFVKILPGGSTRPEIDSACSAVPTFLKAQHGC